MVIRKAFGSGELKIQSGSVIASPAFRKFTKHVKARQYEEEPFIGRKKHLTVQTRDVHVKWDQKDILKIEYKLAIIKIQFRNIFCFSADHAPQKNAWIISSWSLHSLVFTSLSIVSLSLSLSLSRSIDRSIEHV